MLCFYVRMYVVNLLDKLWKKYCKLQIHTSIICYFASNLIHSLITGIWTKMFIEMFIYLAECCCVFNVKIIFFLSLNLHGIMIVKKFWRLILMSTHLHTHMYVYKYLIVCINLACLCFLLPPGYCYLISIFQSSNEMIQTSNNKCRSFFISVMWSSKKKYVFLFW